MRPQRSGDGPAGFRLLERRRPRSRRRSGRVRRGSTGRATTGASPRLALAPHRVAGTADSAAMTRCADASVRSWRTARTRRRSRRTRRAAVPLRPEQPVSGSGAADRPSAPGLRTPLDIQGQHGRIAHGSAASGRPAGDTGGHGGHPCGVVAWTKRGRQSPRRSFMVGSGMCTS